MNCLGNDDPAGNIFPVSNERYQPCTEGGHLNCVSFPAIRDLVGGNSNSEVRVGFVDVEGHGENHDAYDIHLFCPMMVVAKCIIFNIDAALGREGVSTCNAIKSL